MRFVEGRLVRKKQEGTIIVFVVVIIGIIGLLYSSIYILIGIENKIHQSLTNRTKAYYVAESGLDRGIALLRQNISNSFVGDNPFATQYKDTHRYEVIIIQPQPDLYKITSTGTYNNAKRIIEATIVKTDDTFLIQSRIEIN